mmetsp:Transcript_95647/g.309845  ORF Transcript_95647/g.309845 Transcript_95647/m.309845 type:complete len:227 (+) Transcript_95647:825-1505(+)
MLPSRWPIARTRLWARRSAPNCWLSQGRAGAAPKVLGMRTRRTARRRGLGVTSWPGRRHYSRQSWSAVAGLFGFVRCVNRTRKKTSASRVAGSIAPRSLSAASSARTCVATLTGSVCRTFSPASCSNFHLASAWSTTSTLGAARRGCRRRRPERRPLSRLCRRSSMCSNSSSISTRCTCYSNRSSCSRGCNRCRCRCRCSKGTSSMYSQRSICISRRSCSHHSSSS